ncbi:type I 3-dehydroquinate dehydratase, partial [Candidatus Bathyarchaeota archaeon]|nr:type I 3-dehydroquinate dehydratase [Candidatus Bathyarchaeota archaeon]
AQSIKDNVKCLLLVNEMSKLTRIVAFAMGRLGLISRILSPIFGGYFTFASLTENMKTAPGQFTIDELRMLYERLGVYQ